MVNGKPTAKPTKIIRHATPDERVMFWHETDADAAPSAPPAEDDAETLARDFAQLPRTLADARAYAERKFKTKRKGEMAYNKIKDNPKAYGLVIEATGFGVEKLIDTSEGVGKLIFPKV